MSILAICLGVKTYTPPPMLAARKHELSDKQKPLIPLTPVHVEQKVALDTINDRKKDILLCVKDGYRTIAEICEALPLHSRSAITVALKSLVNAWQLNESLVKCHTGQKVLFYTLPDEQAATAKRAKPVQFKKSDLRWIELFARGVILDTNQVKKAFPNISNIKWSIRNMVERGILEEYEYDRPVNKPKKWRLAKCED